MTQVLRAVAMKHRVLVAARVHPLDDLAELVQVELPLEARKLAVPDEGIKKRNGSATGGKKTNTAGEMGTLNFFCDM